ncbi:MAG: DUF7507 domain-containing protein [Anaerolineales bacterium]
MLVLKRIIRRVISIFVALSLILTFVPGAAQVPVALAANTGFVSPTANAAGAGNGFEGSPANAHADGGGFASNINGYFDRHEYFNYGLNIPAGAVVTGIEVRLDGWVDSVTDNPVFDAELSFDNGVTWTVYRTTPFLTTSEATYTLGSSTDLWGRTWSPAEFANGSFAIRVTSYGEGATVTQRDWFLDWAAVRVYYSARLSGTVFSDDDANGVQNGAEAGLNTVAVTFFRDDGDSVFEGGGQDVQVGAATTNASGLYASGAIQEGFSYWVDVTAPASRTLTTPPEPRLVNVPTATTVTTNFGYAPSGSASPAIDIAKTPDTQLILSGATVTFTVALTNTGNVTLSSVLITDTLAPNCNRNIGTLTSGQSQTYTCTRPNVTGDFTNTAQTSGVYTVTSTLVTDSDTAIVDVINPAVAIAKSPDAQAILANGTANFTIAITNTGDVALANVGVTDALAPNCNRNFATLNAGQSQSYACSRTNVTADFVNSAIVIGSTPLNTTVSATDTAAVDVIGPAITLEKTPDTQIVVSGTTASFTIAVTNTGDVALTNLVISDPLAPNCNNSFSVLAVGQSQVYACTSPVVTADFTNTASVTCAYTGGTLNDSDNAQVKVANVSSCPAGILAYLKLDEATAGPTYADQYRLHDGVCSGQCPAPSPGLVGAAQDFNGDTTGIDIPAAAAADFNWSANSSFSVEFWMRADSVNACNDNNEVIVGRTDGSTLLQWWVGIDCATRTAAFVLKDKTGAGGGMIGSTLLTDGGWHHIVAVRDAAQSRNRLFVDGREEAFTTATYAAGFDSAVAAVNLGWFNRFIRYAYDGALDEVAIYNRALASTEVQQHHVAGRLGRGYCALNLPVFSLYLPIISRP